MPEEEKKEIEFIKYYMKQYFYEDISIEDDFKFEDAIKTVLNLIQLQQKLINSTECLYKKALNDLVKAEKENKEKLQQIESLKQAGEATETVYKMQLEKKDKIIDLILDMLVRVHSENKQIELIANANIEEKKKQAKEYFKKKVEESNVK